MAGRPKKWANDAERMAAKRAGENGAPTGGDEVVVAGAGHEVPATHADEVPAGHAEKLPAGRAPAGQASAGEELLEKLPGAGPGLVQWEGRAWPIVRAPPAGLDLEGYVAAAREGATRELDAGRTNPTVAGVGRVERAESYARWRFAGWMAGQIDGL